MIIARIVKGMEKWTPHELLVWMCIYCYNLSSRKFGNICQSSDLCILTFDPEITLLGMYPKEITKNENRSTHSNMVYDSENVKIT